LASPNNPQPLSPSEKETIYRFEKLAAIIDEQSFTIEEQNKRLAKLEERLLFLVRKLLG
jgi:hypothetical protein